MKSSNCVPLVEVTRGPIVESIHFGAIAVVDAAGNLLASQGDPDTVTFMRSSSKPFQALPFIEREGDLHFGLSERDVALMCASHSGTNEHVSVVTGMQHKLGVAESDLMCGTHPCSHEPTLHEMILKGEKPTPNRHNCSGKHTGMLGHAVLRGLPKEDYININHPIQQTILQAFAEMTGLAVDDVVLGVDGCSAPNFAVPLRNAALGFARLCDPSGLAPARAAAAQRITRSMTGNPDMVAGPDRWDTLVMQIASGRVLSKAGAEGYQAIGLMPGVLGPGTPAVGIAFKISDGDLGGRARPAAAYEVLRQLGAISKREMDHLARWAQHPLHNWRNVEVGEVRTAFNLVSTPIFG